MSKKILFTHTDLDGVGGEIVARLVFGEDITCIHSEIPSIDTAVEKMLETYNGEEIIFSDICATERMLTKLHDMDIHPRIFDHHPTNMYATEIFADACIVPKNSDGVMECGTSLLYKYLKSTGWSGYTETTDLFVDTVRSYDTYEWKSTNNMLAKNLQTLFGILGYEKFANKYVEYLNEYHDQIITDNDMVFVKAKIDLEQEAIDSYTLDDCYQFEIEVKGKRKYLGGLVFTSPGINPSELGYQFLSKYPEIDFLVMPNWRQSGLAFRSIKDDILLGDDICKKLGGGGHPKASGAPIKPILLDDIKHMIVSDIQCAVE